MKSICHICSNHVDKNTSCNRCGALVLSSGIGALLIRRFTKNQRLINRLTTNGIITIGEFTAAYEKNHLIKIRSVGRKKLQEFTELYRDINTWLLEWKEQNQNISDTESIAIESVFHENIFNMFREHCIDNEIYTIGDLKGFDFDSLLNIFGFGHRKLQKVRDKYSETISGIKKAETGIDDNSIQAEIMEEYSSLIIEDAFHENIFKLFRRYCEYNNICTIGDLSKFDFSCLMNIPGFGVGKLDKVRSRYKDILSGNWAYDEASSYSAQQSGPLHAHYSLGFIHETNRRLPVDVLTNIGISNQLVCKLRDEGYDNLSELAEEPDHVIKEHIGVRYHKILCKRLGSLRLPLEEFAEHVFETYKDTREYEYYKKRASGQTFQEIADYYELSRERIRQICSKFEQQIMPICCELALKVIKDQGISYAKEEDIISAIKSRSYDDVLIYNLKNCDRLEFIEFANIFIKKQV